MARKPNPQTSKPTRLDPKFWQSFARNSWEKKALYAPNVQTSLRDISADEIFHLLVSYANRCRKLKDPTGFKFYIDGFQCGAGDVLQFLPLKSDKSLAGYHSRMEALFPDYCLVCDELLRVNHQKQHLLTDFTDELYRHVGLPNRFSEMGLYLGNYRKTPFGVHVDSCGVFSFPVVGKKKFRLWTHEFGKKNPGLDRTFSYGKYKKNSQLLEAGPGDMTYWPSSMWHIAESDGSFSATWSLGVWVDQPLTEMVSGTFKDLFTRKLGAAAMAPTTSFQHLHTNNGEVTELPEAYARSVELIQNLSPLELQEAFLKSWMQHISLRGFKTLPQSDLRVSAKSRLQLRNPKSVIFWRQSLTDKDMVDLSFGGVLAEAPKSTGLQNLIKALNAGESCQLSSYLKGPDQKKTQAVLQKLADAGAFSESSSK